ncbi:MAG: hypothetical protein JWO79_5066 [Actinomycetia bacterium]|nr:hypothetical protein [Actinomycetes bacterium]
MAHSPSPYRERLTVSWWAWPAGLLLAVLMAAEVHMGYGGVRSWLPYVIALPLAVAVLVWASRIRVTVRDGELHADDAHIPVSLLSGAEALDPREAAAALGRELHPLAFVVRVPWVRPMVRVVVADPADPTPYWLVSTRKPKDLLDALGLPPAR